MIVFGMVLLGLFAWIGLFERKAVDVWEAERNRENLRRRNIHKFAGNFSYPHELADGRVRWYHVDHDPVEL